MTPFVPLPGIAESAAELWELRRVERDDRRRERLHALWLVASGAASSRHALARQLGHHRETVSRWLEDYGREGRAGLLRAPLPAGRPSRDGIGLPAAVKAAIRARLAQTQGERGYLSLWRWARAEHALAYSYSHFHRCVHAQLGATLKVARKSHGQKKRTSSSPFATRA